MLEETDLTGVYAVDDHWHLFIDGERKEVFVETVEVRKHGDRYEAKHYGRHGRFLTEITVDAPDIQATLSDYERLEVGD